MKVVPITEREFKESITVRFNNILEGLDKFPNGILTVGDKGNSDNITKYLEELFVLNNNQVIVDFYLKRLTSDEIYNLMAKLNNKEQEVLNMFLNEIDFSTVYFKILDKNLIEFFSNLSIKELFFTTFYYSNLEITIWGNYELKFPVFASKREYLDNMRDLMEKNQIEFI